MADDQILTSRETLLKAMMERDSTYEGVVFTAVRTTGVFCRPTCPARKPKPENVEFFESAEEALAAGYRPCKRCRPFDIPGEPPPWLAPIIQELDTGAVTRLTDAGLVSRGLDPTRVRRWFKVNTGMTFHQFVRNRALGSAFRLLQEPNGIDRAAYQVGYESLSGFRHAFEKAFRSSPGRVANAALGVFRRIPTPLGPMLAVADEVGVVLLEFVDRPALVQELRELHGKYGYVMAPGSNVLIEHLNTEIQEYFSGRLRGFNVPVHVLGTSFEQAVWEQVEQVSYGSTVTYQELAARIDRPGGARAVGRANGKNRIALVIPCHRVVSSDGSMGGYGGGRARKAYLLRLEREVLATDRRSVTGEGSAEQEAAE